MLRLFLLALFLLVGSGCNKSDESQLPTIEPNSKGPTLKRMKSPTPDKAPPSKLN